MSSIENSKLQGIVQELLREVSVEEVLELMIIDADGKADFFTLSNQSDNADLHRGVAVALMEAYKKILTINDMKNKAF